MDTENFFSEDASEHFTEGVLIFLREQIRNYQGQEILFGGRLSSPDSSEQPPPPSKHSKISECEILIRGTSEQVPLVSRITEFDVIIHNHPSSYLTPSEEDLEIASTYADEIGFMIIDNTVTRVNVVTPIPRFSQDLPIDIEEVLETFDSGATLSQVLPGYEPRPSQRVMVEAVTHAFNQEKILLCEAETGTGKSLGYGVVAARWALLNKKKVVISTNTINLQEQILNKDLPAIQECLRRETGSAPKIILVKGKNNYLCLRKFEEFKKEFSDTSNLGLEERALLRYRDEIVAWGEETLLGDKNELSFIPDYDLWDKLGCENDTCQRKHCRHENRCFQARMKKDIAKADILIVNHHILCADLAIKKETGFHGSGLLPPYHRLIIDESHHLEDIATLYFGSQASTFEIKRTLGLIARIDFKKKILKGGLLNRILKELSPNDVEGLNENPGKDNLRTMFYNQLNAFIEARISYEDFSASSYEKVLSYFEKSDEDTFFHFDEKPVRREYKHRFTREEMDSERWQKEYRQPLEQILKHLQGLIDMVTHIHNLLAKKVHPHDPPYLTELKAYRERLQNSTSNFQSSMEIPDPNEVRWVRAVRNRSQAYFATHISPLEVGPLLREHLFLPLKTVILTSATLTGSGEHPFQHIKERLGIESFDSDTLSEIRLSNEFDYAQNCRMLSPPLPPVTTKEFLPALIPELYKLLYILRGRMLWLFTSYSMMKTVHQRLETMATDLGVELWIQGDEPRHELIRKIKERRNGVILGVSSFWEGVDIKGENLSCLVMIKLPFAVPDDPVLEARLERLQALGKNPFMDYSLPQAILRFKQGFGRLIRSSEDRGVFILFDNRIFTKNYGRSFIASLPPGIEPRTQAIDKEWFQEFLG